MKSIPLPSGLVALIDDEDFELVSQFHWGLLKKPGSKLVYARAWVRKNGKQVPVLMHRLVTGAKTPQVDHWNGQTLDNQKKNLRPCTHSQNNANAKVNCKNKSGFKGVSWNNSKQKWIAQLGDRDRGKPCHIGTYDNPKDAAAAYDDAATKRYGQFAKTNRLLGLLE